jgi:hypothetical protein
MRFLNRKIEIPEGFSSILRSKFALGRSGTVRNLPHGCDPNAWLFLGRCTRIQIENMIFRYAKSKIPDEIDRLPIGYS